MKRTVNFCEFTDAFRAHDRQDSYSYGAKRAIFDYLESYEEDSGDELELDVIAICCDFSEYGTALEAAEEYGFEPDAESDEAEEEALDWLRDRTIVLEFEGNTFTNDLGGIVIQGF